MDQNNPPQSSDSPQQTSPMPHIASENEPSTQATQPPAPKRQRKGVWAGIIAAIVLVLLAAGAVAGYFLWYQNPDKVVADGVMNAIKAKSATYTGLATAKFGENSSFRLELTGKNTWNAAELNAKVTVIHENEETVLEGDALTAENGDLYVRLHNVDMLVERFAPTEEGSKLEELVNKFVTKVNGQWVKISPDDLKQLDQAAGDTQQCLADVAKRAGEDEAMRSEMADLYRDNRFVIVAESLGSQDGSMGYRLELDEVKLKDFTQALDDTEYYKQLRECDENVEAIKDIAINDDGIRTELWVSQWSHEITKVKVEPIENSEGNLFELSPKFNQEVTIMTPESSIPLAELRADIEEIIKAAQAEAMEKAMQPGQQSELPQIEENPQHTT